MVLAKGTQFGPYEILAPLGAGGMGEVWLARDTRLDRDVAIKALPAHLTMDADRLSRFEREAKIVASLNHPGIAAVYALEEVGGKKLLVMEYVDGETLAAHLKRGPLPVDEALSIAVQIAEALEAAHEKGVIHRDLKPGNVMITSEGKVKVLDFGLARSADGTPSSTNFFGSPDSPTATSPAVMHSPTIPGAIMGTVGYMSPEQARGKPVDKRSDIFSFGCVLYEMLAGAQPFQGETVADSLGAILHKEPDLSRLPASTPPNVRRVLTRCLAKDKHLRLHDIADARLELESAETEQSGPAGSAPAKSQKGLVALSFCLGALVVAGAAWMLSRAAPPAPRPVTRFAWTDIGMPVDAFQGIALSPDGRQLVSRAIGDDARERLHLRSFDSFESKALPGTDLGWMPTFSPDGERVAFYSVGGIKTITLASGAVRQMAQINWGGYSGAVWMPDGGIIFAGSTKHFGRVSPMSAQVETLDVKGLGEGEFVFAPSALPGGEALLCGVSNGSAFNVAVFDIRERTLTQLAEDGFTPTYSSTGHVLYQQGQSGPLMALPFDAKRRAATGPPMPVVSDMATRVSYQVRLFAIAENGTLAYIPKSSQLENGALNWVDRNGVEKPIFQVPRMIDSPRLSHDGRRIAFRAPAPECNVWMHDVESGVTTKITHEGDNHGLAWSHDDARMLFCRLQVPNQWGVMATAVNGTGEVEPLSPPSIPRGFVSSISPDGQWVLVDGGMQAGAEDVYLVNIQDRSVKPLLNSRHVERAAAFSPDGRYIAFVSEESGRGEIHVQSFPKADERHQVSTDGGYDPVWSRDGKELFFRAERKMMAAEVSTNPSFTAGRPHVLFETRNSWLGSSGLASYDVSADGQRFVMIRERSPQGGAGIHVVLNWFEELKALAPKEAR
ncbi:MAG TPA: protein kinase [Phycisphaerae bacterium]|nr:protein kinase [Phycisphaerae bacterium]